MNIKEDYHNEHDFNKFPRDLITNFNKEKKPAYLRSIKDSNFGEIIEVRDEAFDCHGHKMSKYCYLWFKV